MRLSFNYIDKISDRNTDRSSLLVNIIFWGYKQKPRGKVWKTYFVLKIFYKRLTNNQEWTPKLVFVLKSWSKKKSINIHKKTSNVQNNSFFLVAASVLAFFIKRVTIDERKSKKHLKNKSMTKIWKK